MEFVKYTILHTTLSSYKIQELFTLTHFISLSFLFNNSFWILQGVHIHKQYRLIFYQGTIFLICITKIYNTSILPEYFMFGAGARVAMFASWSQCSQV